MFFFSARLSSGQVDSARQTVCTSLYSSFRLSGGLVLSLAHLYCYVIYLGCPTPARRNARPSGCRGISGAGGCPLLFTLANFAPREATHRVYQATHNFALSRLTNAPAYSKLRRFVKVCIAGWEGDEERESENDARPVSILSDRRD